MGKRKKRKSNVGTIIMIIVIVLLSLFVYLLATKRIDFNNKNDDLVEDNTNIDNNKNNNDKNDKTISKEEAITISKEKMPVMISLANQKRGLYGYCGEFDEDADFLTIGNDTYLLNLRVLVKLKNIWKKILVVNLLMSILIIISIKKKMVNYIVW